MLRPCLDRRGSLPQCAAEYSPLWAVCCFFYLFTAFSLAFAPSLQQTLRPELEGRKSSSFKASDESHSCESSCLCCFFLHAHCNHYWHTITGTPQACKVSSQWSKHFRQNEVRKLSARIKAFLQEGMPGAGHDLIRPQLFLVTSSIFTESFRIRPLTSHVCAVPLQGARAGTRCDDREGLICALSMHAQG